MARNSFESGEQKNIPAVLVYIQKEHQTLMIFRNGKTQGQADFHMGKWNGLGGKCEVGESPLDAAQREVYEESGIRLEANDLLPVGVILFPNFKPHKNEDWTVYVFLARTPKENSESHKSLKVDSSEGDLHWVATKDLLSLNLWPGDRLFLPLVLSRKPFIGTIWYENGQVARHWIGELGN